MHQLKARPKYGTAASRWAGIGPYYAMFPASFAQKVIRRYTKRGDAVLDPFAGRGTAAFAAAMNGRLGVGIEINPVGWVYANAKLNPSGRDSVETRLKHVVKRSGQFTNAAEDLPDFYRHCYTPPVRRFLLSARNSLNWRYDAVDRTLMALLLVHLHGKRSDSFSNQMRQTKAMSPAYAIEWWLSHESRPPDVDPLPFMLKKIAWRYAKGLPEIARGRVYLGDCVKRLKELPAKYDSLGITSFNLLLTSPPYCGLTNYHYDQWLRLWLLGGPELPKAQPGNNRGKFYDQAKYRAMLENVFCQASVLLAQDSIVYVRTDSRELTLEATVSALKMAFPKRRMRKFKKPFDNPTQTKLFGGESGGDGEIDILLRR